MSNPLFLQSAAAKLVVYLCNADGTPATTLTHTDVTVSLKKTSGIFVVFPITALTFVNQGAGLYEITLASTDTDVLGSLYLWITGATIKSVLSSATVVVSASLAVSPGPAVVPSTGNISGTILNPQGKPSIGVSVSFSLVSKPTIMPPGYFVTSSFVTVTTDSAGQFDADLLLGATYEVIIPDVDYRRVFTVTGDTGLLDIP